MERKTLIPNLTLGKTLIVALLGLMLCYWPGPSRAQQLPALFHVVGVASNDTLNIRSAPSGSASKVGELAFNATGVEITALNASGTWGRLNVAEGTGWVAMRFLQQTSAEVPTRLSCYGTEPFWDLEIGTGMTFSFFGTVEAQTTNTQFANSSSRPDRFGFMSWNAQGILSAGVSYEACSDGMSDREFGLAVDVLVSEQTGVRHYSGCCSLMAP